MRPVFRTSVALVVAVSAVADARTYPTEYIPDDPLAGNPTVAPRSGFFAPSSDVLHEFYFTRARYTGYRRGYSGSWAVDYPKADQQFLVGLTRQTIIDAYDMDHVVDLDDPELRRFPFLYALEVGAMQLTPPEIEGLRTYLEAGGFLMIDDFWGTREWENFVEQIGQVLPGRPIVEVPMDHAIFNAFYNIDEVVQVPNVRQGIYSVYGYPTYERDGIVPHVRGIFDDKGRLMVGITWNSDLGDAWEWADDPRYPLKFSTYAWAVGINFIVYAMSH